jgi:hypothetical protein
LKYENESTNTVDLRNSQGKTEKAYRPPKESLPIYPLKKARQKASQLKFANSSSQPIKDDLSLISMTKPDHQAALITAVLTSL